jgi:hypothetical protein
MDVQTRMRPVVFAHRSGALRAIAAWKLVQFLEWEVRYGETTKTLLTQAVVLLVTTPLSKVDQILMLTRNKGILAGW